MGIHWFVTSSGDCPGLFLFFYTRMRILDEREIKIKGVISVRECVWGGRGVCVGGGVCGGWGEGMREDAWETTVQFHLFQTR